MMAANAPEPTYYVMAPRTETQLAKLKDSTGQPLRRPDTLAQARFVASTIVPVNETHGTATGATRIITGDFSQVLVGVRTALRVEVLRERYADALQYGFLAWLRMDAALAHPDAFAQVVGITA
ncbi:MAG: phage major capsid protein [Firmicutes bacterium]|nr:phage major capsid protein [Bacillota bacterium]